MTLFARQLLFLSLTLLNALPRNSQTKELTTERISSNYHHQHHHNLRRHHRVNDSSSAANRSWVAVPSGAVNSVRRLQRTASRDDDGGESGSSSSEGHVSIGQDLRRRRRRRRGRRGEEEEEQQQQQGRRRSRRFVIGTNSDYAKHMNNLPADLSTRMKATDAAELAVVAALKKRDRMSVEALKRTLSDARTVEWQVLKQLLTGSPDDKTASKLYGDYKKLRRGRPNLNAMMDEENKNFFFSSMNELNEYTQIKKEELDVDKYLASTQVSVQRLQAPPAEGVAVAPAVPAAREEGGQSVVVNVAPVVGATQPQQAPVAPTVPPSILPPVLPPPSMPPPGQQLQTLPGPGRPLPSRPTSTPLASSEPRSGGAIVWIIVGVCAGLAVLGLIIWIIFSKKKQREEEDYEQEPLYLKKDSISEAKRESMRDSMAQPMSDSETRRDSKAEKRRRSEPGEGGSKADMETDQKRGSKALVEPKRESMAEALKKKLSLSSPKSDAKRGSKAEPTEETKAGPPDTETKAEQRRESKAEPKTESTTEPRRDSKAAPKTEAKRESTALTKIESLTKPEQKRESKMEPRRESKMEPRRESKMEPRRESKMEPRRESKMEPRRESKPWEMKAEEKEKTGFMKKIKRKMSLKDNKKGKKGVVPIEERAFLSPVVSEKEISSKVIPPPPLSEPGEPGAVSLPPPPPPGEVPKPPLA